MTLARTLPWVIAGVAVVAFFARDTITDLTRQANSPRAVSLAHWATWRTGEEPILMPSNAGNALDACVGNGAAFDACAKSKERITKIIRTIGQDSGAILHLGACMIDGCDRAVLVAPINACMWVLMYAAHPDAPAAAKPMADKVCARLTSHEQKRITSATEAWLRDLVEEKDRAILRSRNGG